MIKYYTDSNRIIFNNSFACIKEIEEDLHRCSYSLFARVRGTKDLSDIDYFAYKDLAIIMNNCSIKSLSFRRNVRKKYVLEKVGQDGLDGLIHPSLTHHYFLKPRMYFDFVHYSDNKFHYKIRTPFFGPMLLVGLSVLLVFYILHVLVKIEESAVLWFMIFPLTLLYVSSKLSHGLGQQVAEIKRGLQEIDSQINLDRFQKNVELSFFTERPTYHFAGSTNDRIEDIKKRYRLINYWSSYLVSKTLIPELQSIAVYGTRDKFNDTVFLETFLFYITDYYPGNTELDGQDRTVQVLLRLFASTKSTWSKQDQYDKIIRYLSMKKRTIDEKRTLKFNIKERDYETREFRS